MDEPTVTPPSSLMGSTERLEAAVRNHAVGIFETDAASGAVYWSDELQRMFGYDPGSFDQQLSTWRTHAFPEDLARVDKMFAEAIANKTASLHYNYRMKRRDGEVRHIEASVQFYYDVAGNHIRRIGVNVDATARIADEVRLRTLFDQMHEGFFAGELMYNEGGEPIDFRYVEANAAAEELTGICRADSLGKLVSEVFPGTDGFWLETYARVVKTGNPVNFTHFAAPLGRWYHVRAFRYAANCFASLFVDATEEKNAEEAERNAQRSSLKASRLTAMGAMASTLAHELNQPLSAAVNYLAIIQRTLKSKPESHVTLVNEAAEGGLAAILRAAQIIKRMRTFTLEGRVEKSMRDLSLIIADSADEILSEQLKSNILVRVELHEHAVRVNVDKVQLGQVFSNLFRNAATAMFEQEKPREIIVRSTSDDAFIEVTVTDTGPGIPKNEIEHIFDPFESSKQSLGLGLPICRTIVEAHGGTIWAKSAVGFGAEFTIRLLATREV